MQTDAHPRTVANIPLRNTAPTSIIFRLMKLCFVSLFGLFPIFSAFSTIPVRPSVPPVAGPEHYFCARSRLTTTREDATLLPVAPRACNNTGVPAGGTDG
jgi:hypothetical protein